MNIFEQYKRRKAILEKQLHEDKPTSEESLLKAFNEDKKALFSDWQRIGSDFPIRNK